MKHLVAALVAAAFSSAVLAQGIDMASSPAPDASAATPGQAKAGTQKAKKKANKSTGAAASAASPTK